MERSEVVCNLACKERECSSERATDYPQAICIRTDEGRIATFVLLLCRKTVHLLSSFKIKERQYHGGREWWKARVWQFHCGGLYCVPFWAFAGKMVGGYNVLTLIELLDSPDLAPLAAAELKVVRCPPAPFFISVQLPPTTSVIQVTLTRRGNVVAPVIRRRPRCNNAKMFVGKTTVPI